MDILQLTFPNGLSADLSQALQPFKIEVVDASDLTKVKKRFVGVLSNYEAILKNVRGAEYVSYTLEPCDSEGWINN